MRPMLIKIAEAAFEESQAQTYAGSAAQAGALLGIGLGALMHRRWKPVVSTGIGYGAVGGILGGLVDRNSRIEGGNN